MIAWSPVRDDNFYPVMERLMREPQFLEMEFRMGAMPCSLDREGGLLHQGDRSL